MQNISENHIRTIRRRVALLVVTALLVPVVFCISLTIGAASVPLGETIRILCGGGSDPRFVQIIMSIRLPQALAAVLAGAGLAISGATMQGVLRNPLSSPFTLGISSAAAFGAALALFFGGGQIVSQDNTFSGVGLSRGMIAAGAFFSAMLASGLILLLGRLHGAKSETIILVGIALNSLFTAGITLLQYLSDDARLAAIVYWTFGDTARADWNTLALIVVAIIPVTLYFLSQSWNYNALAFGEETALGLGVPVRRLRMTTMFLSSLLTAVLVAMLGIIGFIGLVVPHVSRLFVGSDNRFLLPFSLLFGGLLLLTADTFARIHILPVSILTSFIGVPVFLALLFRKGGY